MPALLLAETPDDKACLDPAAAHVQPRAACCARIDRGPERKFRLTRLLQRGADFERVAFDESG